MKSFELDELACYLLGKDYDKWSKNEDISLLEDELYEKFDINYEAFEKLVESLAKFTIISESPLTKSHFQGFVDPEAKRYIYRIMAD